MADSLLMGSEVLGQRQAKANQSGLMRLLHVVPLAAANVYYQAFSEFLPKEDFRVDYVSFELEGPLHRWLSQQGAKAHTLQTGTSNRFLVAAFRRLKQLLGKNRYDLVHLHCFPALAAGLPAARACGIRRVLYTHHYGREVFLYRGKWVSKVVERFLVSRADHVVAISEDVARYLNNELRIPSGRMSIIRYGFDFDEPRLPASEREALRAGEGIGAGMLLIGCVGRLHWTKGQRYLLEAVAHLPAEDRRRFMVVFLGEGPDRRLLEHLSVSLNLQGQVKFLGHRLDVRRWYPLMDVLVHPSLQHGYEQVIVEAMAVGCPVISTPVGIAAEIIESGHNGWLVSEGRAGGITEALRQLSPSLLSSAGKAAGQTVQDRIWSRKAMVEAYERLYRSMMAQIP